MVTVQYDWAITRDAFRKLGCNNDGACLSI